MNLNSRVDDALGIGGRMFSLAAMAGLIIFLIGIGLKPLLPFGLPRGDAGRMLFQLIIVFGLTVAHIATVIIFDRGKWAIGGFDALAFRPVRLLIGAGTGALVGAVPAAAILAASLGTVTVNAGQPLPGRAIDVAMAILVFAAVEEIAVRGYLAGIVEDRWGGLAALVLSALAAMGLHLVRGGAPEPLALAGAGALGLTLGGLRVATGGIAAGLLAHVAFDTVRVMAFGEPSLAVGQLKGGDAVWHGGDPVWLTGGADGASSGAVGILLSVVITFLLFRSRARFPRTDRT